MFSFYLSPVDYTTVVHILKQSRVFQNFMDITSKVTPPLLIQKMYLINTWWFTLAKVGHKNIDKNIQPFVLEFIFCNLKKNTLGLNIMKFNYKNNIIQYKVKKVHKNTVFEKKWKRYKCPEVHTDSLKSTNNNTTLISQYKMPAVPLNNYNDGVAIPHCHIVN